MTIEQADPAVQTPVFRELSLAASERVHRFTRDRVSMTLVAIFVIAAAFYAWSAATAQPIALHGSQSSPYNRLADAFLHFHLWVAHAPAGLLNLPEPYNPAQNGAYAAQYPDYALYGGNFYITWGPAPVLVLLLPLHLLGFEPSSSVIMAPFAIVGLGFALASLRVLLGQVGRLPLWICGLAALTMAFSTVVPFLVQFPLVYHQAIAAGFCFVMAGVWLALSAIASRRASLTRVAIMSLCFGLAAGSRPTLGLAALVLVPVYKSLRPSYRRRSGLAVALAAPVGGCLLLLAAYNQARFASPLDYGTKYQLAGTYGLVEHYGEIGYLIPGLWSYLLTPPRLYAIAPFIRITTPQIVYPLSLPAHYRVLSELTGGLLPMTPIAIFLAGLPWLWRRRPQALGPLGAPLMVLALAGIGTLLFLSYEFFSTTERYEVDYTALLLLGALAVWLALCRHASGRRRRLIRVGGALLATWSCLTGIAIAYQEIDHEPGVQGTVVDLGSPLSRAISAVAGGPVLAEVNTRNVLVNPERFTNIGSDVTAFWLGASDQANFTIVSPDRRRATLVADLVDGPGLRAGAPLLARISGPGKTIADYRVPSGDAQARIPLQLNSGINRFVLSPLAGAENPVNPVEPQSEALMEVTHLSLVGH